MEVKKTKKANLETRKGIFLQIGYIVTLGLVLLAFEYTSSDVNTSSLGELPDLVGEEEIIPITQREEIKPPEPPKPQKISDVINLVDDDVEIEDEIEIDDFEADQDDVIEIIEVEEEEEEEAPVLFMILEDKPSFQGGYLEEFRNWVQSKLEYPQVAMENGISGTVFLSFVISKNGNIEKVSILRGVDPVIDNEAIRVIKSSPKWSPGKQRGRSVPVQCQIPIKFILQ